MKLLLLKKLYQNIAKTGILEHVNKDYWDYATLLELAIFSDYKENSENLISDVLVHVIEDWESKTTANNLKLICEYREAKGQDCKWIKEIYLKLN